MVMTRDEYIAEVARNTGYLQRKVLSTWSIVRCRCRAIECDGWALEPLSSTRDV